MIVYVEQIEFFASYGWYSGRKHTDLTLTSVPDVFGFFTRMRNSLINSLRKGSCHMRANWSKAECAPTFRLLITHFRRCFGHRLHMARPPTSVESQTVSRPTPQGDKSTIENIAKISNGALLLPRARNWKGILPACFHSSLKGGRRVAQRESLRRKRVRTHSICARSEISYVAIRNQNAFWR